MKYSLDTKLGTLLDHPTAKAIIEKYVPGISSNPMIGLVKGMTLNALIATPQAAQYGITKEKVEAVLSEINKVIN